MSKQFSIQVEGKAPHSVDTADEALRWALGHVHRSQKHYQTDKERLESGLAVAYCYGFACVHIEPKNLPS